MASTDHSATDHTATDHTATDPGATQHGPTRPSPTERNPRSAHTGKAACSAAVAAANAEREAAGRGVPHHAFDPLFLDLLLQRDAPPTAPRAAVAGPWEVAPAAGGWRVGRQGEGRHDEPAAWLEERQDALLLAAVLPVSVAGEDVKLRPDRGPEGYDLVGPTAGETAGGSPLGTLGRLAWFDPELASVLAVLRALVAAPRSLALLLEAAGHDALDHAGRLLAARAGAEVAD
jgi:hypothetical protein